MTERVKRREAGSKRLGGYGSREEKPVRSEDRAGLRSPRLRMFNCFFGLLVPLCHLLLAFLPFAGVSLLSACGHRDDGNGGSEVVAYGQVAFKILDSRTEEPVPYTSIKLGEGHRFWGATGSEGAEILTLPVGEYLAEFQAALYQPMRQAVEVVTADSVLVFKMVRALEEVDRTSPRILGWDVEFRPWDEGDWYGGDHVWILFSEAMDRASVENAVTVRWSNKANLCDLQDNELVSSSELYVSWVERNIFHVQPPPPRRDLCCKEVEHREYDEDTGRWEVVRVDQQCRDEVRYWRLEHMFLDPSCAVDLSGNQLADEFAYPPSKCALCKISRDAMRSLRNRSCSGKGE